MLGLLAAIAWLMPKGRLLFGGEDPALGNPWYHEEITRDAARAAGWSMATQPSDDASAADALAWHADYVDSYLYNPFWWAAGGISRVKAALLDRAELVKVHFDDLTSTQQIRLMWLRYLGGTAAGLLWAAGRNDVAAARHIVGVGLHALQDFYTHSNWVDDPNRRAQTWFDAAKVTTAQSQRMLEQEERAAGLDGGSKVQARVARTLEERMVRLLPPETRRELALPVDQRDAMHLHTGVYENPSHLGFKDHGKFAFDCALLREIVGPTLMNAICSAISPVANTGLCLRWRECKGAAPGRPDTVLGVRLPDNLVLIEPPGIALDSAWMAEISRQQRDLPDRDAATGAALFQTARSLATRHSTQWLAELERLMTNAGFGAFWQRVKTERRTGARKVPSISMLAEYLAGYEPDLVQFEDASRMPFTFLSAGRYPPNPTGSDEGWFLRLELQTADEPLAGTDADIVAEIAGRSFRLNHMHERTPGGSLENRLLEFNDFERGSRTAYVVGPFAQRPAQLVLRNKAASGLSVVAGAWEDLRRAVSSVIDALGGVLLSLIGGHADFVGSDKCTYSWSDLLRIADAGGETMTLECNGGSEGIFRLHGRVAVTRTPTGARATVKLTQLQCVQESTWDRASNSDEPFVLLLVNSPLAPQTRSRILGPFADYDTGETRSLGTTDITVDVPRFGGLIVPVQLWESDDEGPSGRQTLLNEFTSRFGGAAVNERSAFLDAAGRAIAPDWKVASIDAFGFRRSTSVEVAHLVKNRTLNRWVEGGDSLAVPFEAAPSRVVQLPAGV